MRVPLLRLTILLALAVAAFPTRAALDVPAALQGLAGANVATVVLVPPMAIYQKPLDRAGLQTAGCHYTTADGAAIRALVAVLRSADVTAVPVYQRPDMREAVYFAMEDGSKFSVLFADNAGGRLPVPGVAEATGNGQIQSVAVSGNAMLSTAVRDWAMRFGGAGSGNGCDLQSTRATDPQAPPAVPTSIPPTKR